MPLGDSTVRPLSLGCPVPKYVRGPVVRLGDSPRTYGEGFFPSSSEDLLSSRVFNLASGEFFGPYCAGGKKATVVKIGGEFSVVRGVILERGDFGELGEAFGVGVTLDFGDFGADFGFGGAFGFGFGGAFGFGFGGAFGLGAGFLYLAADFFALAGGLFGFFGGGLFNFAETGDFGGLGFDLLLVAGVLLITADLGDFTIGLRKFALGLAMIARPHRWDEASTSAKQTIEIA